MPGAYILHSQILNKYYIGATNNTVEERLAKHNNASYGKHRFTATTADWELFLYIQTTDYAHAIRVESKIKAMKSAKYILDLKKYPELLSRLVNCTKF